MKVLAEFFINNRVVTLVIAIVLVGMGVRSFNGMPRLEDPEFTIKDALVITPYPGASAEEVEREVTDKIEQAVQQLGQLDSVTSRSERGLSTVTVSIQDRYGKATLPQVWDELRRKINDAQSDLPPGSQPSTVVDDYGDVYGVCLILYGEEYSYAELREVVDFLKRELLLVDDVAKIDILGENPESVYVELNRARLAQLGFPEARIAQELQNRNLVQNAGRVQVGREYLALSPTGGIASLEEIENIRFSVGDSQLMLRDIATVRRGYTEPQREIVRFNGSTGIAMGISTRSGGNVITMGKALESRMQELIVDVPLGIQFGVVSVQSDAVTQAIDNFMISLVQAVIIVIVVLLIFMGLRSGLLIGGILIVTILGSFVFLQPMGVALERISLGALIIALGMLVDNAIVVVDGMLVRINRGEDPKKAAVEVVSKTAIPLLGATAIAVLAFAAIGTSQDSTGEFCRSLFQVILVSLTLSWVTAVTITPLLGILLLKRPDGKGADETEKDPYDTAFYRGYKNLLRIAIRFRWATIAIVVGAFATSLFGFGFVKSAFFPPSTRPQFLVDIWLPQGTHIDETDRITRLIESRIMEEEGVTSVSSFVGRGALRFLLTYGAERPNPALGHLLVDVEDSSIIDSLIRRIDTEYDEAVPDALIYGYKFELGPGSKGKIEARFYGDDPTVLRQLCDQAVEILRDEPSAKAVRTDWRQRVKVVRPQLLEQQAAFLGLDEADVASALRQAFAGLPVGVYREGDQLLPIYLRAPEPDYSDIGNLFNLQLWSPTANRPVPISQVVGRVKTVAEDEIIIRRDRLRSISAYADPVGRTASELLASIRPKIEAIELPDGYYLEWGGEFENSGDAQASLASSIPLFIGAMILMTIFLFNSLKQPLVIWMCVPLILVGMTAGLLLFDQPFNFMAILGFLSLVGMMIKNAIVLVDEINDQNRLGVQPFQAIIDSGASRLRPVAMAAATTALGMLPLFADAFFIAMAITIIFGLMVGSVLTMVVLPVIYATVYRIPYQENG